MKNKMTYVNNHHPSNYIPYDDFTGAGHPDEPHPPSHWRDAGWKLKNTFWVNRGLGADRPQIVVKLEADGLYHLFSSSLKDDNNRLIELDAYTESDVFGNLERGVWFLPETVETDLVPGYNFPYPEERTEEMKAQTVYVVQIDGVPFVMDNKPTNAKTIQNGSRVINAHSFVTTVNSLRKEYKYVVLCFQGLNGIETINL